jgi:hypothetical protein
MRNDYKLIASSMLKKGITAKGNRWAYPWSIIDLTGKGSLLSITRRLREMCALGYLERDYIDTNVKAYTLTKEGEKFAKSK